MITITDSAKLKISEILSEEANNSKVRVFVQGGGCSGFSYGFSIESDQSTDDFLLEFDNIKFVIDAMSATYLTGAEINYKEDIDGSKFVISNPNAVTTCGCGSSFSPF